MLTAATISKNTKETRRALHVSQEEFARLLDTTLTSVSRWERGRVTPVRRQTQRLDRLHLVIKTIGRMIRPDNLEAFLTTPHRQLSGLRPLDMLDNENTFKKLLGIIESAKSGDMA